MDRELPVKGIVITQYSVVQYCINLSFDNNEGSTQEKWTAKKHPSAWQLQHVPLLLYITFPSYRNSIVSVVSQCFSFVPGGCCAVAHSFICFPFSPPTDVYILFYIAFATFDIL